MWSRTLKVFGLIGFIGLAVGFFWVLRENGLTSVESLTQALDEYREFAFGMYVLLYIAVTLFFLPGTPFSLAGGALFGSVGGFLGIMIGATIGATCAFLVARYFFRDWASILIEKRLSQIKEYDDAIGRDGFRTVLLLRLVPIFPFNGLNFALGVTKVSLGQYVLATFLGIIPGVAVLSFLGGALASREPWAIALAVCLYGLFIVIGVFSKKLTKQ
jgi:uncharacterized membrane protein YdjX (TVP38/TMEM64 family)